MLHCIGYVIPALMSRQGPVSFIPFSLSPALLPQDTAAALAMLCECSRRYEQEGG